MKHRAVKGMNDVLPEESAAWQALESAFVRHAELHGFREVRTPLVEPTELFVRSIGEVTDVVQKEMYTFEHGDGTLTLRPEGTASAARAYVQHGVQAKEPVSRWYYLGPMFRAERPQRGRSRQFHQAGCEIYGDHGPVCDAELIGMLVRLFTELGIGPLTVKVNSVGGAESRTHFRERLLEFLRPRAAELSELSRQRLDQNPLRVLDSKNEADQRLLAEAPSCIDTLVDADRAHFDELCELLRGIGVSFEIDPRLVRGLDYYTRTVFEIQSSAGNLGAQNTLVGGGRYDGLLGELGGPEIPAIGFATGLERLLLAMGDRPAPKPWFCAVLPLGAEAARLGLRLTEELCACGVRTQLDGRDNGLKSKLRRADGMGAALCLVIGDSELARGVVQLKDLVRGEQVECPVADAVATVERRFSDGAGHGVSGDETGGGRSGPAETSKAGEDLE